MPQSKEGTFMTEASIIAALLAFMQRQETTEADFNQLALQLFAWQFDHTQSPLRPFLPPARPYAADGQTVAADSGGADYGV